MTRLGRASALLAVFAGDYAILMLVNGQLTDSTSQTTSSPPHAMLSATEIYGVRDR
jgi:hypothetical protein